MKNQIKPKNKEATLCSVIKNQETLHAFKRPIKLVPITRRTKHRTLFLHIGLSMLISVTPYICILKSTYLMFYTYNSCLCTLGMWSQSRFHFSSSNAVATVHYLKNKSKLKSKVAQYGEYWKFREFNDIVLIICALPDVDNIINPPCKPVVTILVSGTQNQT